MPLGPLLNNQAPAGTILTPNGSPHTLTFGPITYDNNPTLPANQVHNSPKFVILHFRVSTANQLAPNQEVTVRLANNSTQQDRFNARSGRDFWTRPISTVAPNRAVVTIGPGESIELVEFGYGILDIFKINGDPSNSITWFDAGGITTPPPRWRPINTLAAGTPRRAQAAGVGMLVYVRHTKPGDPTRDPQIGQASASVIGDKIILTAGHAIKSLSSVPNSPPTNQEDYKFLEILSGSFTLDYDQSPGPTTFHKLLRPERTGFRWVSGTTVDERTTDYFVAEVNTSDLPGGIFSQSIQIPTANGDVAIGGEIYSIHHPGGRTKRISQRSTSAPIHPCVQSLPNVSGAGAAEFANRNIVADIDLEGGSSGGPFFAEVGGVFKIIGIFKSISVPGEAPATNNFGPKISIIVQDLRGNDPDQYVRMALTVDSSGSMGLSTSTGITKMAHAINASRLFIEQTRLMPTRPEEQHNIALVDFDTNARVFHPLTLFALRANRDAVLTRINQYQAGGQTTIGGALQVGGDLTNLAIPQTDSGKVRAMLLMTDGLQNSAPSIASGETRLTSGMRFHAIGFGTEASLNGQEMTRLAEKFGGDYLRAESGLSLLKFYAIEYGQMLENGIMFDPPDVLPAGQTSTPPVIFNVLTERSLTMTAGWERPDAHLSLSLMTPSGVMLTPNTPGVEYETGPSWAFLRVNLPFNNEHVGQWQGSIERTNSVMRLHSQDAPITRVSFSTDGVHLISASEDSDGRLWNVRLGRSIRQFFRALDWNNPAERLPVAAKFTPGSAFGLLASESGFSTYVVDLDTGLPLVHLTLPDSFRLLTVVIHPDGRQAAGVLEGVGVAFWGFNPDPPMLLQSEATIFEAPLVRDIAYDPNGRFLAILEDVGGEFPGLSLLDLLEQNRRTVVNNIPFEDPTLLRVIYTRDGQYLLIGCSDGRVLRATNEIDSIVTFIGEAGEPLIDLVAHPYQPQVLILYSSGLVRLWEMDSNSLMWELGEAGVRSIDFSPDGVLAVTGHEDGTLMLWNAVDGTPLRDTVDYDERYFMLSTIQADVFMRAIPPSLPVYTGDALYPQAILRYKIGACVPDSRVEVEITRPTMSIGEVLMQSVQNDGVLSAREFKGDVIGGRHTRLIDLENRLYTRHEPEQDPDSPDDNPRFVYTPIPEPLGAPERLITTVTDTFPLFDDGQHFDGAIEPDGQFGNEIRDITQYEGTYHFRAVAHFGPNGEYTRETCWSVAVMAGIDAGTTTFIVANGVVRPDGQQEVTITFTPRDRYNRLLGPGLADELPVSAAPGSQMLTATPTEPQPGTYRYVILWSGQAGTEPGLIVSQPGRLPLRLPPSTLPIPDPDPGETPGGGGETPSPVQQIVVFLTAIARIIQDLFSRLFRRG